MHTYEYATMRGSEDNYWWYRGLRRLVTHLAAEQLVGDCWRLLDAGCGTGGQLAALRQQFPQARLCGLDLARAGLDFTRARGFHVLAQGSATQLPYPTGQFDAVLSLDVLQMAGLDLPTLPELARVLKPGGWLFLNLPAFPALAGQHDAAVKTVRRYLLPEVLAGVCAAGLRPARAFYWNCALFIPAWLLRRLRQPTAAAGPTSDLFALPELFNQWLTWWIWVELRLTARLPMPFGTSVFVLAQK